MTISAISPQSALLDVGDSWELDFVVKDDDGYAATPTLAVVVTTPGGTTASPTPEAVVTGYYRTRYTVAAAGRHTAVVTASGTVVGVVTFACFASSPVAASAMPTASDAETYLGTTGFSTAQITAAFNAEVAAQRATCRIPAVYPADLKEALFRRVARNLAARTVPTTSFTSFEGGGTVTRVPMRDPEIVRLEAPYRRLVVG